MKKILFGMVMVVGLSASGQPLLRNQWTTNPATVTASYPLTVVSNRVGVGTNGPQSALHVVGSVTLRGSLLADADNAYDLGSGNRWKNVSSDTCQIRDLGSSGAFSLRAASSDGEAYFTRWDSGLRATGLRHLVFGPSKTSTNASLLVSNGVVPMVSVVSGDRVSPANLVVTGSIGIGSGSDVPCLFVGVTSSPAFAASNGSLYLCTLGELWLRATNWARVW